MRPVLALGFFLWLVTVPAGASAQGLDARGEASVAAVASDAPLADRQLIARYVPELMGSWLLSETWCVGFDVSVDGFASAAWADGTHVASEGDIGLYRAWVRVGSPRIEARAGLQKITFGSGAVFRPLMWFDRIDPRDPLQVTEGVWGLLARYYAPNNANAWAWVLYGNEDPTGWNALPSDDRTPEVGGRGQLPVPRGEMGVSYHHRRVDLSRLIPPGPAPPAATAPEDRIGFDGKWDVVTGLWFEAVWLRQDSPVFTERWRTTYSIGVDYTIGVGNGLSLLGEWFALENVETPAVRLPDLRLGALTASYPLGPLNLVAGAYYHDFEADADFRLVEWRHTRDRWRLHVMGFWNPRNTRVFPTGPETASLSGSGVQALFVVSH